MLRLPIALSPLLIPLAGAVACSFDAAGIAVQDQGGTVDTASIDLDEVHDAAADLAPGDGPPVDRSYPDRDPDVGQADTTPPPDTQPPPDTTPPPSCAQTYGGAPSYKPCAETTTSCAFYTKANASCDSVCKTYGGTCQAAAMDSSDGCAVLGVTTCGASQGDGICTCSK